MKKNFMPFGCALLMSTQLAYAGLVIGCAPARL